MMRRALAINLKISDLLDPTVAIRWHNLGVLLANTDRLNEAEPMLRRAAQILVRFRATTNQNHRLLEQYVGDYHALLTIFGLGPSAIQSHMNEAIGAALDRGVR